MLRHPFTLRACAHAVLSALFVIATGHAVAGPDGGQVVGGTGSISQSGLNTTINQATQNMAINWQSYNVNVDERVQYIQPNSSAISLNRILSNNGSTIAGRIDANGQVILVNPNGVFFTPTASINVGGIIASSLDIAPNDFMNGNYIFNEVLGADGAVVNSGMINASLGGQGGGNVALIGKQVKNDGLIVANLGTVTLAAGKQAVLTFDQGGLLGVRVSEEILQEELGVDPAVMNSGEIKAEGGRVLITASTSQDVFSQAVNTNGIDQASSVVVHEDGSFTLGGGADVVNTGSIDTSTTSSEQPAGRIVLLGENVTSSGELRSDAASGNGGEIELHANDTTLLTENSVTSARADANGQGGIVKVLGDKVGLFDQSTVDVSGANGGGKALIGGDFQGKNDKVRNAAKTVIAQEARIKADAESSGDGGVVIVWADQNTYFWGDISVRGGSVAGNGGLVETSGKEQLLFDGTVDLAAPHGLGGILLLDPEDIFIVSGDSNRGTDNNNQLTPNEEEIIPSRPVDLSVFFGDGGSSDYDITASRIALVLASGNVELQARRDIVVNESIVANTGNTNSLTLRAGDDVVVNRSINLQGGALSMTAGDTGCGSSCVTSGGAGGSGNNIEIAANANLLTTGAITLNARNDVLINAQIGNATRRPNSLTINANNNIITSAAGSITTSGTVDLNADFDNSGVGNIILFAGIDTGNGRFEASGVTFDGRSVSGSPFGINTGTNDATIDMTGTVLLGRMIVGGDLDVTARAASSNVSIAQGTFEAANDILDVTGVATFTSNTGGSRGEIALTNANNLRGEIDLSTTGAHESHISLNNTATGATTTTLRDVTVYGNLTVNARQNLTLTGTVTGAGNNSNPSAITTNIALNFGQSAAGIFTGTGSTINTIGLGNDSVNIAISGGSNGDNINLSDASISTGRGNISINGNGGADAIDMGSTTVTASIGNVTVSGNDGNDAFTLSSNNVTASGAVNYSGDAGNDTFNITTNASGAVNGGDDNDTFNIASSYAGNINGQAGNDIFNINTAGVTVTLVGGTETDTVRGPNTTNSWLVNADGGGTLNTSIAFSEMETLTGGTGTGVDTFTVDAGASIGTLNGQGGNDVFNVNGTVTAVNGDGDNDTINVAGTVLGLIDGGTGSGDTLNITAAGDKIVQVSSTVDATADYTVNRFETITGNNSTVNTLRVSGGNSWNINTDNGGSVGATTFNNFAHLVGGNGNDTFTVGAAVASITTGNGTTNSVTVNNGGSVSGAITGGDGVDDVIVNTGGSVGTISTGAGNDSVTLASVDVITTVPPAEALAGGSGTDSLTVNTSGNTWALTTQTDGSVSNSGTTRVFTGFESLNSAVGSTDTLDYSGITTDVDVDLNSLSGIGTIIGNNGGSGSYTASITGWNGTTNTWQIGEVTINTVTTDGLNDGTVDNGTTTITFANFNSLIGGTGNDNFILGSDSGTGPLRGSFAGTISGGGGLNSLTARDVTNTWTINASNSTLMYTVPIATINTAVTTTFNGIQRLEGGAGSDNVTVNAGVNTINTNAGADSIIIAGDVGTTAINAGAGNDSVSVSGTISSVIDGGADNDTLTITRSGNQIVQIGAAVVGGEDYTANQFETINATNGATGNVLRASGGNVWSITTANGGDVAGTNFSNFANLVGGSGADNFVVSAAINSIDAGAGDNIVTVNSAGTVTGAITTGGGIDTVTIAGAANSLNTGGGNDSVIVSGTISGVIDGGTGTNDALTITRTGNQIVQISGSVVGGENYTVNQFETINAANGATGNTLRASGGNTWNVTTVNSGSVAGTSFSNFANLVGGAGSDTFNVNAAINSIDMGDGANSITVNATGSAAVVTSGAGVDNVNVVGIVGTLSTNDSSDNITVSGTVTTINAGNGADTIMVNTGGTVASINGEAGNDNITVNGAATSINGGVDNDSIVVGGIVSGLIDGGTGTDSVTLIAATDAVVEIGNRVTSNINIFQVESVTANAAATNTLIGDNAVATWSITGNNSGTVAGTSFANFNNLTGGNLIDTFNYQSGGVITGLINGGGDADVLNVNANTATTVQIVNALPSTQVNNPVNTLTVFDVATINGDSNLDHTLVGPDTASTWAINTVNSGTINFGTIVGFSGFRNLTGGAANDTFNLTSNSTSELVTGVIRGGGQTAEDVLSLTGLTGGASNVVVRLGSTATANELNVDGIERITGNNQSGSTLIAADIPNNWNITGANDGTINVASANPVTFTDFGSLQGGSNDDNFLITFDGTITASIDGGAQATVTGDTADYSSQTVVAVNFGSVSFNGITGLEGVLGNGTNSTLNGPTGANADWSLSGLNEGSIMSGGTRLGFRNFNYLVGGNGDDTFTISNNGALRNITTNVPGMIYGGGGNNNVNITLASTGVTTGQINYVGGTTGTDTITILDNATNTYQATYTPAVTISDANDATNTVAPYNNPANSGTYDQLGYRYTNSGMGIDTALAINFREVETVTSNQVVDTFTVNGAGAGEIISLNNGNFQTGLRRAVNYTNVNNLTVAGAGDTVNINNVNLAGGTVTLTADAVTETTGSILTAGTLSLVNTGTVGASGARLDTNVNNLQVTNSGPVYINETAGSLNLSGMNTTGLVDIVVNGGINSSATLVSSGQLILDVSGDINLSGQTHQLSGPLMLTAANGVSLDNGTATTFAGVNAQSLNVTSAGNITDTGTITVAGVTTLNSGGDIVLDDANDFGGNVNVGTVTTAGAANLTLNDINSINVGTLNTTNSVNLTAADQIIDGNGGAINIISNELIMRAVNGITLGGQSSVGTQVSRLDAINTSTTTATSNPTVTVSNTGELTVANLQNDGDVFLYNDNNIIIDPIPQVQGNPRGAITSNYQGGVDESVYAGDVNIFISSTSGSISAQGNIDTTAPEIIGENVFVIIPGTFGSQSRLMHLSVHGDFYLLSQPPGYVVYYGGRRPRETGPTSLVVFSNLTGLSGQQLIEVESLGDVDPAIFTEVRNYFHEDVAILLPEDQRLVDDEEEEKKRQQRQSEVN